MPQKRFFALKKWRGSLKMVALLGILYLIFVAVSSLFANSSAETYIEVIVGDYHKYGNDSRLQPVFDVLRSTDFVQYIPVDSVVSLGQGIATNRYVPDCGLQFSCPKGEFAVHIYTGKDHNDEPKLCIDGKYVIGRNVNSGGRGINIAVIDTLTNTIVQVKNFDTYEHESTQLETLLLTLRSGDILVMLTFDEPTKMLSRVARLLFHDLGSAMAQNLQYRASWYLVTQKGLAGFAPFEGLNLIENDGWPAPHNQRFCVPLKMEGQSVHPDPLPRVNPPRQAFCQQHDGFPIFCDEDVVNDPLLASPPYRSGLAGNDIFNVPIVVMSGDNVTFLPLTLETLVRQPGINPKNVVVYYLPHQPQVAEMVELLGFMSEELSSQDPCAHMVDALETTSLLFPDAKSLMFLESNVILSPDFLSYMGQTLPLLAMDPTINFISAWNDNGFLQVSGVADLLHRSTGVSSLALLMRKKSISKDICQKWTRGDWLWKSGDVVVVPDLSRVMHLSTEGGDLRTRNTSLYAEVGVRSVHEMVRDEYERLLDSDLQSAAAVPLDSSALEQCEGHGFDSLITELPSNSTGLPLAIYYREMEAGDHEVMGKLSYCLGLPMPASGAPRGSYRGLLRLTWSGRLVYLVESSSPHYARKPPHLTPLT